MKLGGIIKEYRMMNNMSMSDFAKASGLSKPYISMLESNKNSNGGKPIAPSVETLKKVADAIHISLDDLLRKMGDEKINLSKRQFDDEEIKLIEKYRTLTEERKRLVKGMIVQLSEPTMKEKKTSIVQNNKYGNNYSDIRGGIFKQSTSIK